MGKEREAVGRKVRDTTFMWCCAEIKTNTGLGYDFKCSMPAPMERNNLDFLDLKDKSLTYMWCCWGESETK